MIDHLDDDAVSASLDGEATEAELAHLATCATCAARADAFRAAAIAIASVPPPDPAARDRAIAAALAPPRRRAPMWALGAAAAVLALAAVGGVISRGSSTKSANMSAEAASTVQDRSLAAPSAASGIAGESSAAAPPSSSSSSLGAIDAGTFADRVRAALAANTPNTVVSSSCATSVRQRDPAAETLRYAAGATVAGRPVDVLVFVESSGMRAFAVAPDTCQDVLSPVTVR